MCYFFRRFQLFISSQVNQNIGQRFESFVNSRRAWVIWQKTKTRLYNGVNKRQCFQNCVPRDLTNLRNVCKKYILLRKSCKKPCKKPLKCAAREKNLFRVRREKFLVLTVCRKQKSLEITAQGVSSDEQAFNFATSDWNSCETSSLFCRNINAFNLQFNEISASLNFFKYKFNGINIGNVHGNGKVHSEM